MSGSVLKIRHLDSGKYLATVGKKARLFDTLPDAVLWAETKMTNLGEEPNHDQGTTESISKY
jgi:hypothetical protein